jgi:adenine deaminase
VANAFIKGFGLKKGAIASSMSHDSHNIVAIGYSSEKMAEAVNMVIENMGGIAVVSDDFEDSLSLPIAGLMSNQEGFVTAKKLRALQKMAFAMGCRLTAPFMTMAFMSLLVIPSIKLSDKGLFDGDRFEFMDIIRN